MFFKSTFVMISPMIFLEIQQLSDVVSGWMIIQLFRCWMSKFSEWVYPMFPPRIGSDFDYVLAPVSC